MQDVNIVSCASSVVWSMLYLSKFNEITWYLNAKPYIFCFKPKQDCDTGSSNTLIFTERKENIFCAEFSYLRILQAIAYIYKDSNDIDAYACKE